MKTIWYKISFGYLFIIAWLGLYMRMIQAGWADGWSYNHLLHGHSHAAFTGWFYGILFLLIDRHFFDDRTRPRTLKAQFIATQVTLFLMMIAFLAQGYGIWSITLSSVFQILNYLFVFTVLRALKQHPAPRSLSVRLLRLALWMLFVSTIGPWAVGIIKALGYGGTDWYRAAIYFYMHFQYNGWILSALLALFFAYVEKHYRYRADASGKRFFVLFAGSILPGYFLSLLGMFPEAWVYAVAGLSAVMQARAMFELFHIVREHNLKRLIWRQKPVQLFAIMVVGGLIIKILLQLLSVIPALSQTAFNNRPVIIAFIHLIMLGIFTPYILAHLTKINILRWQGSLSQLGQMSYFIGFVLTEFLLAGAIFDWWGPQWTEGVAVATLFLTAGVTLMSFAFSEKRAQTACSSGQSDGSPSTHWYKTLNGKEIQ